MLAAIATLIPETGVSGRNDWATPPPELIQTSLPSDLFYTKADNITGEVLYPTNAQALVLPELGEKLEKAAALLAPKGYGLTILDAWRPPRPSALLWLAAVKLGLDKHHAPPQDSAHTRGAAVDVTLHRLDGMRVEMPTPFDSFPNYARKEIQMTSPETRAFHASLLKETMARVGLTGHKNEWWHFELPNSWDYPMLGSTNDLILGPPTPR